MDATGISAWRKAERQRLIDARMAMSQDDRSARTAAIVSGLETITSGIHEPVVSLYWPFRGEPDLRPWMETVNARGGTCLLPLVVAQKQPLIFRAWRQGEPLERGVWNIPVPASGPERTPRIVIAPLVGFDQGCFRLGYGGGFFDRTLAAFPTRPMVIGVGYAPQAMPTIEPQWHDIPMDFIITEDGVRRREPAGAGASA